MNDGLRGDGWFPRPRLPRCVHGLVGSAGLFPVMVGFPRVSGLPGGAGVCWFPPLGLGQAQGWNDCFVNGPLRIAASVRPSLRFIGFVDDLRSVEGSVNRAQLSRIMARFLEVLARLGVRIHSKETERWRMRQPSACLGFEVDAKRTRVQIPDGKRKKG